MDLDRFPRSLPKAQPAKTQFLKQVTFYSFTKCLMNTDSTRNWNYNDGKAPRAHSHTSSVLTPTLGREGCEKPPLAFMMLGAPEIPQCLSVKGERNGSAQDCLG